MNFNYKITQLLTDIKLFVRILFYWVEYFSWILFSLFKFKRYPKKIKKVLIVSYGALGDSFSSLRIAYNLSVANREIEFYLFVDKNSYDTIKIIAKNTDICIIRENDLTKENFDLTLLFNFTKDIKKYRDKFGFIIGNEYHSVKGSLHNMFNYFINKKNPPLWRHKIKQELEIAKLAGLHIPAKLISYRPKEDKNVSNLLKENKIKIFGIIHPSGRNFASIFKAGKIPAMAWPLERFASIADYLIENYEFKIILTGTKDEKFIGDKVIEYAKNKKSIFNFSGKLDVNELVSLISHAKILLSVDTSVVHIAEFTGTPVIVLFGPTFYEEVGVYGDKNRQINLAHPEKCIRDRKKGFAYNKENMGMISITTEEVKSAIDRIIK